jgi:hypothetical protein
VWGDKMTRREQKALNLISEYGGIDGGHHKQWLLNELVKILADDYDEWVRKFNNGEDGPYTYRWDKGIAP